jgi:hypothetical protein
MEKPSKEVKKNKKTERDIDTPRTNRGLDGVSSHVNTQNAQNTLRDRAPNTPREVEVMLKSPRENDNIKTPRSNKIPHYIADDPDILPKNDINTREADFSTTLIASNSLHRQFMRQESERLESAPIQRPQYKKQISAPTASSFMDALGLSNQLQTHEDTQNAKLHRQKAEPIPPPLHMSSDVEKIISDQASNIKTNGSPIKDVVRPGSTGSVKNMQRILEMSGSMEDKFKIKKHRRLSTDESQDSLRNQEMKHSDPNKKFIPRAALSDNHPVNSSFEKLPTNDDSE